MKAKGRRHPPTRRSREVSVELPFLNRHLLEIFRQLASFERPADEVLHRHFRAEPKLGQRDRHAIAERVYYMLRHRRRLVHRSETLLPPGGWPSSERWDSSARLLEAVLRDPTAPAEQGLDDAVAYSLPAWLFQRLQDQYASDPEAARALYAALLTPASLDLRVAVWHPSAAPGDPVTGVMALLAEDGIEAQRCPGLPNALRIDGNPALERTRAFSAGLVEVQDAGSQVLAALLAPRRGQVVVDFCAGAGGKTLALGAAMRNTGQVFACDVSAPRLARMRPRLQRSGLSNIQPIHIVHENDSKLLKLTAKADAVLVDAPCSGSGTWRRNPDLKWRFREEDLREVLALQARILRAAARLVRPGGWLVYASCSLLRDENEAQVESFLGDSPEFATEALGPLLDALGVSVGFAWFEERSGLHFWRSDVARDECDGFFAARMRRQPSAR
jgi:16S rRNA (cytosine967-C5)-methyltransferase